MLEMQNRTADGIAWMTANADGWAGDPFFKVDNWWHLALYHLDRGDIDVVLRLFDTEIYGARSGMVLDMFEASALLWRLHLRGIDVGDRWDAVADNGSPIATAGNDAFNDAHALMAFVGSGRRDAAVAVIAARFGGSDAQRDVLDLTLIEAALRSRNAALATALAAERLDARHESPLAQLLARRAETMPLAA
jgi:hypothetical protein